MNTKSYIESRIAKLEVEISKTKLEAASCIQPAELSAFAKAATAKLDKAYASFCASIQWRVVRRWSAGTSSLKMGTKTKEFFLRHGTFRLVAAAEEKVFVRYPARFRTPDSAFDYPKINLAPSAKPAAYLSFDLDPASPLAICYGDHVVSAQRIDARIPGTDRKADITAIVKAAMIEHGAALNSLLAEFYMVSTSVLRRDRIQQRVADQEQTIRVLKSIGAAFREVHLPLAQTKEVIDQLERFAGPTKTAPALLLKGPPGTGKTLLAQKIAEGASVPVIKANVTTLKGSGIGASAAAVKSLWSNARATNPCILFIDECDSVFAQRGSTNTDVIAQELTNAFLAEWTGKEAGVWVIAATNRRDVLDDAILSRFGLELEISNPDEADRVAILRQELNAAGYAGQLPEDAGKLTQGMSGRDLSMLAQRFAGKNIKDFPAVIRQIRSAASPMVDEQASWATLIVSDDTRNKLETTCALLRDAEGWSKRGLAIPAGILLEGPAGTGKTQIARTIAREGGLGIVNASVAHLKGMYLGHAAANVRDVFSKARALSPAVLFIDELDVAAPRRDGGGTHDALSRETVSQLLQEMDGIVSQRRQVFVLAATNHPENVDLAILSRFTERIAVPLPDLKDRMRFLKMMLERAKMRIAPSTDELLLLGELSKGMSNRDLKNWVSLAQRRAVGRAILHPDRYDLVFEDLMNTVPEAAKSSAREDTVSTLGA